VDVHGRLHFGPPKNGRVRSVSLPGFLVEQVAAHLAARPHEPDNFIFSAENGGPFRHSNFYGRAFKPAVSQALPEHLHGLRFHDLRHTCAALLIAQGTHPKAISDRLGHSSISVTMDIYGHLFPEQDEKMAAGLDAVYQQAVEDGGRSGQVVGLR
jgi:integrase